MWPVEHYAALDFGLFGFRAAYLYSICVSFFDSKFKLALGIDNDEIARYNVRQESHDMYQRIVGHFHVVSVQ